jgi:hypothetical protein
MADPFWERFCTPLAERILAVIRHGGGPAADAPYILEEPIAGVQPDGRYVVGGDVLPTKGTATLTVGQRVHVLWRRGRREIILTHQWQRAQGGGHPPGSQGRVEELLLAEVSAGVWDVVFRNDQQAQRLNLQGLINADRVAGDLTTGPFRVGWGQPGADNQFYVLAARSVAGDGIAGTLGNGSYRPRIYVFRLSRPVGEPAGGDAISATHVQTIDPVAWAMPGKFNAQTYTYSSAGSTLIADVPHRWPYAENGREFAVILEPDAVTLIGAVQVRIAYATTLPFFGDDSYVYLVAVRTDAAAILWEAPTTDEYRAPFNFIHEVLIGLVRQQQRLLFGTWSLVEWTGTQRRVAVNWSYLKHTGGVGGISTPTIQDQRYGTFLETGTLATRQTIEPWYATTLPGAHVGQRGVRWLYRPASPRRVLYHHVLATSVTVSPPGVLATMQLRVYDPTTNASVVAAQQTGVDSGDNALLYRGAAVQYLGDDLLYAIAEDSAVGPTIWPPADQREQFVVSPAAPNLDPAALLAEDPAHVDEGELADWPAGITPPDPIEVGSVGGAGALRLAYHAVGPA